MVDRLLGTLLVEMRNAPCSSQRMQVGTVYKNLGRAALFEFNPDVVVAAERRRCSRVAPRKPAGAQLPVSAANRISAEIDKLLRRSQGLAPADRHGGYRLLP
jgi:hypothetical protein